MSAMGLDTRPRPAYAQAMPTEYTSVDFVRCADCQQYWRSDLMVDVDGDGGEYCPTCSAALEAAWVRAAARAPESWEEVA